MLAKTVDLQGQEVYDNSRLWAVLRHTFSFSQELDIVPILRNDEDLAEYLALLRVIELTYFSLLSTTWRLSDERNWITHPVLVPGMNGCITINYLVLPSRRCTRIVLNSATFA